MANTPKEPKIVKAPAGCSDYLTEGKEYKVIEVDGIYTELLGYGLIIVSDEGRKIFTNQKCASCLDDKDWIVVE